MCPGRNRLHCDPSRGRRTAEFLSLGPRQRVRRERGMEQKLLRTNQECWTVPDLFRLLEPLVSTVQLVPCLESVHPSRPEVSDPRRLDTVTTKKSGRIFLGSQRYDRLHGSTRGTKTPDPGFGRRGRPKDRLCRRVGGGGDGITWIVLPRVSRG